MTDTIPAEIAQALCELRSKIGSVPKTAVAKTGRYDYRYATLADVIDAIAQPLTEVGLSFAQSVSQQEAKQLEITRWSEASGPYDAKVFAVSLLFTTTIIHQTGACWTSNLILWCGESSDPQRMGSTITYGRRYSLLTTFGLATDDDDGAAASASAQPAARASYTKPRSRAPAESPGGGEGPPVHAVVSAWTQRINEAKTLGALHAVGIELGRVNHPQAQTLLRPVYERRREELDAGTPA